MRQLPITTCAVLCTWSLTAGAADSAPGTAVAASQILSGQVYSVYDPLYGRDLPEVRRNQNGQGHRLAIRGQRFGRGFGCWRFSIIELKVPAAAATLTGTAGIDDEASRQPGDTYFSVWADGRRLWLSPALGREDPAIRFSIPLKGQRRIKLLTDSQGYENTDLADWCDLRWAPETTATPTCEYVPQPDQWHLRAELHPFHLLYRGEPLPVTAITARPGGAFMGYTIRSSDGATIAKGETPMNPDATSPDSAVARWGIPLGATPSGQYDALLVLRIGSKVAVTRRARFSLLDSRLGTPASESICGVNHHEFVASYEPLAAAGIEWSRQWFCRDWIEPRPGKWSWNWYDERMAAAREFGIKTIGVLGGIGQPAWSSPAHVAPGQKTTPGYPVDMAAWEAYVRQVATRYRGQVQVWESWNEVAQPATAGLYGWSVPNYVELHRRTWRVLKDVDPANRLLVSADRLGFLQACLDADLGETFDGIAVHPYRPGNAPEDLCANSVTDRRSDLAGVFADCQAWLTARRRAHAGVWATEIGWPLTGADWTPVSIETHAQYAARTFILAQGSGTVANVCWHDFAHGMFGLCDDQGFARPALLSLAGTLARLNHATPLRRLTLPGGQQGLLFSRGTDQVLALWSRRNTRFVSIRPPAAGAVTVFDWFGTPRPLALPAAGRTLPVAERPTYLEGPALDQLELTAVDPIEVRAESDDVVAGQAVRISCSIENRFAESAEFGVKVDPPNGLRAARSRQRLTPPLGAKHAALVTLKAGRAAVPGERSVPVVVVLPDGTAATFAVAVRILAPLAVSIQPFDGSRLQTEPIAVAVTVRNQDREKSGGTLTATAPAGFTVTPARTPIATLAAGVTANYSLRLRATRPARSTDRLVLRATTSDGTVATAAWSLAPVVLDANKDGLADGWTLDAGPPGPNDRGNLAEAALDAGDTEFSAQRITCTRFNRGWIILRRDNQDHLVKDRRYRLRFRARQRDLDGTLTAAVYNITPWQNCGIERQFRVGSDWQDFTAEFTATRDSSNVRFEFYFTATGTVWLEGMCLEPSDPGTGK